MVFVTYPDELQPLQSSQNHLCFKSHLSLFSVRKELFHSKNGARKNAKKILIVITDGQKYRDPLMYSDVIPQAEKANITRYAIGVQSAPPCPSGSAFSPPGKVQWISTA